MQASSAQTMLQTSYGPTFEDGVRGLAARPLLKTSSFACFLAWLLGFFPFAFEDSVTAFVGLPLFSLAFIGPFALFALLLRARKLGRVHLTMTLVSLGAAGASFVFILTDTALLRTTSLMALTFCAAYLLVGWGSVLRNEPPSQALGLCLCALLVASGFQFAILLLGQGFGIVRNLHIFLQCAMALLSVPLLLTAVLFYSTRGQPTERRGFSPLPRDGSFLTAWRGSEVLPFAGLLFVCSISVNFVSGFTYSPRMFDSVAIGSIHALTTLLVAAGLFFAFKLGRRTSDGAAAGFAASGFAASGFAASVLLVIRTALVIVIVGVAALFFGQVGVFISRGLLAAALDLLFVCALLFAIVPADGHRHGFFSRYLVSVLCSGFLWAQGLGVAFERLLGYDHLFITIAGVVCLGVLCLLLLASGSFLRRTAVEPAGEKELARQPAQQSVPQSAQPAQSAQWLDGPGDGSSQASRLGSQGGHSEARELQMALTRIDESIVEMAVTRLYRDRLGDYALTEREKQIAYCTLEGKKAISIASDLGISERTVRFHLKNTYDKCGVHSKSEFIELLKGRRDAR